MESRSELDPRTQALLYGEIISVEDVEDLAAGGVIMDEAGEIDGD